MYYDKYILWFKKRTFQKQAVFQEIVKVGINPEILLLLWRYIFRQNHNEQMNRVMTVTLDTQADNYITPALNVGDKSCWRAPSDRINQIINR